MCNITGKQSSPSRTEKQQNETQRKMQNVSTSHTQNDSNENDSNLSHIPVFHKEEKK